MISEPQSPVNGEKRFSTSCLNQDVKPFFLRHGQEVNTMFVLTSCLWLSSGYRSIVSVVSKYKVPLHEARMEPGFSTTKPSTSIKWKYAVTKRSCLMKFGLKILEIVKNILLIFGWKVKKSSVFSPQVPKYQWNDGITWSKWYYTRSKLF